MEVRARMGFMNTAGEVRGARFPTEGKPGHAPGSSGYLAITYDMAGSPPGVPVPVTAQCAHPTPH